MTTLWLLSSAPYVEFERAGLHMKAQVANKSEFGISFPVSDIFMSKIINRFHFFMLVIPLEIELTTHGF